MRPPFVDRATKYLADPHAKPEDVPKPEYYGIDQSEFVQRWVGPLGRGTGCGPGSGLVQRGTATGRCPATGPVYGIEARLTASPPPPATARTTTGR